jgi:hypothetical protein
VAPRLVLVPAASGEAPGASDPGATVVTAGDEVAVGGLRVVVHDVSPRLTVTVIHAGAGGEDARAHGVGSARGPP